MSLRRDAIWTAIDTFGSAGLAFAFRLLVAKVLSPHDFGVAAIVLSIVMVLQVVNDFGLTAALIQKDEVKVTPDFVNTTFTASMIVAVLMALATAFAVAPLAAEFYHDERIGPMLMALSVSILTAPFIATPSALLSRRREFKAMTINRAITTVASLMVAGVVLWLWPSPWVVVAQAIMNAVMNGLGLTFASRWRFRFKLVRAHLKELFGFSSFVLGGNLISMFSVNAGVFVLGRVLSPADVGLYSLAQYMTDTVRRVLMGILNRVTFVHYSQQKHDKAALRKAYISTVVWNCRILIPIMTAMCLFGPTLAIEFLGPKWNNLGPVIQWLSLAIVFHSAGGAVSTLYKGIGRPGLDLAMMIFNTLMVLFPALLIGAYLDGITGAALATAIVRVVAVLVRQVSLNSLIGSTAGPIFKNFLRFAMLQIPLGLCWLVGRYVIPEHPAIVDALLAAVGLGIYGLLEFPRAFPNLTYKLILARLRGTS